MQTKDALVYLQNAPIGGWNAKDPLPVMPETDAIQLINLIPTTSSVRKRKGYIHLVEIVEDEPIESLFSYNNMNGDSVLIACTNNLFYDLTTNPAVDITNEDAEITSNLWESIQFGDKIFFVNGVDDILYYPNDDDEVDIASFTGITTETFVNTTSYNGRLYFVEKKSTSVWYGNVSAIAGDLTEYNLHYLLKKGGYLVYAGSSTNEVGDIQSDLFIMISSEGELLVFTGDYPGSTTWSIVGHFYIPRPVNHRAFFQMGSDLQIITEEGILTLSELLHGDSISGRYKKLSDKITREFTLAAKDTSLIEYWQGIYYPSDNLIIVNISKFDGISQYVMNTLSGGWCKFTNIPALCWVASKGILYFGDATGNVWKFGTVENDAVSSGDKGIPIFVKGATAFTYCGTPSKTKLFTMIKPIIRSVLGIPLALGINTEFADDGKITTIPATAIVNKGTWDESLWDSGAVWADSLEILNDIYSIFGEGINASILFEGNFDNIELEIFTFFIYYKPGGIL